MSYILSLTFKVEEDSFAQSLRKLLQDSASYDAEANALNNVVDVTLEFNTTSSDSTPAVIRELQTITGSTGNLQVCMQNSFACPQS